MEGSSLNEVGTTFRSEGVGNEEAKVRSPLHVPHSLSERPPQASFGFVSAQTVDPVHLGQAGIDFLFSDSCRR